MVCESSDQTVRVRWLLLTFVGRICSKTHFCFFHSIFLFLFCFIQKLICPAVLEIGFCFIATLTRDAVCAISKDGDQSEHQPNQNLHCLFEGSDI